MSCRRFFTKSGEWISNGIQSALFLFALTLVALFRLGKILVCAVIAFCIVVGGYFVAGLASHEQRAQWNREANRISGIEED